MVAVFQECHTAMEVVTVATAVMNQQTAPEDAMLYSFNARHQAVVCRCHGIVMDTVIVLKTAVMSQAPAY